MKRTNRTSYLITLLMIGLTGCTSRPQLPPSLTTAVIGQVINQMTEVMIHDITNPPLAARFFSYACLAGYEVVAQNDPAFKSMYGVLKEYPELKKSDTIKRYDVRLSAVLAMLQTAQKMQPSGKILAAYEQQLLDSCRRLGFEEEVIDHSSRYAKAVSKKILAYAKADRYNMISNYPRYTPIDKEGCWYPTPPAFLAAVEPYFNTVRPLALDSCSQFPPPRPVAFSTGKKTAFYKMLLQNYSEGQQVPAEHRIIAAFWDCNPFAIQDDGHLILSRKKISPGAHWLGITGIACEKAGKGFEETMHIYTSVAVGLLDAFICCWDEKYRSNRIRPETAIRKYIDPTWVPVLQTPPFPEYLSGHSVISACSATILTHFFGNNFSYTDSVEVAYGLPPRSFTSFQQAAQEAAISRFYGGIHFMDAIDNGLMVGGKVGALVVQKINPQ
ncbi:MULTISPECIES: vanadium-dependent haloperoxidase [Niastella]|uniref:Vanadium-dependent haloperoxidase n=1 Tax=Niastella soli TaxID=2821487 RepID=A0ABS3Z581_9BACT|nr:vanadium-dependent haloperoxidase [Niastella soli]MBO9205198.1 vanadium-dependent haloperoxidase [Niastella soli]